MERTRLAPPGCRRDHCAMAVVAGHELLEREEVLDALGGALSDALAGSGRLVLVAGESGVGKTAAVRAFVDASCRRRPVHWGACDPLSTPVPLAPFLDLAAGSVAGLGPVLGRPCTAYEVFAALRAELGDTPAVLVIEDAHWADEATLDVLRILGRRITTTPLLVVVTHRDEPSAPVDPLRVALGDLASVSSVVRISVEPLSPDAVRTLAAGRGVDSEELVRRTGGNPFYVTEVLEAGDDGVPPTVRDAVMARLARLDADAREVLDVIACSPQATEDWVLDAVCDDRVAPAAAGVAAGILVEAGAGFGFRHEIAREAVADVIPADRRAELHRLILDALESAPVTVDSARLAHHAEMAGDVGAAVRYAAEAAVRAAAVGAHRQAAASVQPGAALLGRRAAGEPCRPARAPSGRALRGRRPGGVDRRPARGDRDSPRAQRHLPGGRGHRSPRAPADLLRVLRRGARGRRAGCRPGRFIGSARGRGRPCGPRPRRPRARPAHRSDRARP